jgi:WD40 repeat protein
MIKLIRKLTAVLVMLSSLLTLTACSGPSGAPSKPTVISIPMIVAPSNTPVPTMTVGPTIMAKPTIGATPHPTVNPIKLTPRAIINPITTIKVDDDPIGVFFDTNDERLVVIHKTGLNFYSLKNYSLAKKYDTSRAKNDANSVGSTDNVSYSISDNEEWVALGQWEHYSNNDKISERGVVSVLQIGTGVTKILGQETNPSTIASPFSQVRFMPGNQQVAGKTETANSEIIVWDVKENSRLYSINSFRGLNTIAFSSDKKQFAVCSNNGFVELRSISDGKLISSLLRYNPSTPLSNCGVAFNYDGSQLAYFGDEMVIQLWNKGYSHISNFFPGHLAPINQVVYSPNDQQIASSSTDGLVRVWDIKAHRQIFSWLAPQTNMENLFFSPDGQYLIGEGVGQNIYFWRIDGEQYLTRITSNGASFSHDGKWLASYTKQGAVYLWKTESIVNQ